MVAYLFRMGVAIPGRLASSLMDSTIEPNYQDPNNPVPAYGMPVVMNAAGTGVNPVSSVTTAAQIYGLLLQPYPEQAAASSGNYGAQTLGTPVTPPTQGVLPILKRGRAGVAVNSGSAAAAIRGGQAHVWIAATAAGHTQGQIEATESPGNTIALPAYFEGPCDSNGYNDIAWNL
jgi:hypothetical protein